MTETTHDAAQASGLNPHYRPQLPVFHTVEIIARPGTECGVVLSSHGALGIVIRRVGEEWPAGYEPKSSLVIEPGKTSWRVETEEFGPAIGHEYQEGPDGKCKVCGN